MKLVSDHSHSTPYEPSYVCMYICRTFILRACTVIPFPDLPGGVTPTPGGCETSCEKLLPARKEDSRRIATQTALKTRFNYRSNRSPTALTRDHSGRGAIRRITPMRRLSLFLRYPLSPPLIPLARIPSPRPLFLASSSASRASSRSPTAFPPFCAPSSSLSLSLPFASTSAQSRVWVCAVVPRCFSPTTRLPLSPHWGHRVARYRGAISRIPASPRDAPISAMVPRSFAKKASTMGWLHLYGVFRQLFVNILYLLLARYIFFSVMDLRHAEAGSKEDRGWFDCPAIVFEG